MNPKQAARQAARRYFHTAQDRRYFLRQMGAEANFTDATSPAGAQGYAQIIPSTARSWGVHNVHDPVESYNAAAAHMATYLRQYGGSWAKALTAYNAGPGRVGGALPAETRAYIDRILGGNHGATSKGGTSTPSLVHTPGHTTTTTDKTQAITDALLSAAGGKVKGSLHHDVLGHAVSLINSGQYTTTHTTPGHTDVRTVHHGAGAPPADGHGQLDHFDGKPVAHWIAVELRWARAHGWAGSVTSGYRTDAEQKAIYDRGTRPAAVPKAYGGAGSNHEGLKFPLGAVDVSNAGQLASILAKRPGGSRLVYAGAKDPVHFSHPHGGGY